MSTAPGHFVIVTTDAGPHLRVVGANGEIILTSEPYADVRAAERAIVLVGQAYRSLRRGGSEIVRVDETGGPS